MTTLVNKQLFKMETGSEKTKEASSVAKTSAVRVGVRVRPFTAKEISASRSSGSVLTCIRDVTQEIRLGSRRFTYDAVFDETVSQEALYRSVAGPLMGNFLEGFNATVSTVHSFHEGGTCKPDSLFTDASHLIVTLS